MQFKQYLKPVALTYMCIHVFTARQYESYKKENIKNNTYVRSSYNYVKYHLGLRGIQNDRQLGI